MAYSNFTLEAVVTTFQLEIVESAALFAEIEAIVPSFLSHRGVEQKGAISYRNRDRESKVGTDCC